MNGRFIEILIATIIFLLVIHGFYGLFTLIGYSMDHCQEATSNYQDYRFCLGI